MTPSPTTPPPDEPADDTDLVLYALDALDDAELRTVETILASDAAAAAAEGRLRRVASAVAAGAGLDTAPPPGLRDRVLEAARLERPPRADLEPTAPSELHLIEGERLVGLLRSLTDAEWAAPVDPPEFAGWTVGDVVAHLATVQAYFAQQLGIDEPRAPERHPVNEDRTQAAIGRHRRDLAPPQAIAEVQAFLDAVDTHVARLTDPSTSPVVWWGDERTVDQILVVRAFELWIHARDIALATGRSAPVPAAPSLRTMSTLATALTPVMCERAGTVAPDTDGRLVRFELTGPGGATHDTIVGPGVGATTSGEPASTITIDIVDYCLAVADRTDGGGVPYRQVGDADLAAAVIAALPALATL